MITPYRPEGIGCKGVNVTWKWSGHMREPRTSSVEVFVEILKRNLEA